MDILILITILIIVIGFGLNLAFDFREHRIEEEIEKRIHDRICSMEKQLREEMKQVGSK